MLHCFNLLGSVVTCPVCLQAQKVLRDVLPLLRDLRLRCRDEQEPGPSSQAQPQLWLTGGQGTAAQAAAAPVAAPALITPGCSSQGPAVASAAAGGKPAAKSGSDSASSGSHSGSRRPRRQQGQSPRPQSQAPGPDPYSEYPRPSKRQREGRMGMSGGSGCLGRGECGSLRLQANWAKRERDEQADAASDSGADSSAWRARPKRACTRSGLCMSSGLSGAAQAGTAAAAAAAAPPCIAPGPSGMDWGGAPGEDMQAEEAEAVTGGASVPMLSPGKGLLHRAVVALAGSSWAHQPAGTESWQAGTGAEPCYSSGQPGQAHQVGYTRAQQAGGGAVPGCSSGQSAQARGAPSGQSAQARVGASSQLRARGPAEGSDEQLEAAMQDGDGSRLFTRQYVDVVLQEVQEALQPQPSSEALRLQPSDGHDEHEQVGASGQ